MRVTIQALIFSICAALSSAQNIEMTIDATDLPRGLLYADVTIPLTNDLTGAIADTGGELPLWYPKWVPGSHAPGGPVQNIAWLEITNASGDTIDWRRTPGEVHRILAKIPQGETSITVRIGYICNQPTANSRGLDSFGADAIGLISPNTVLVYPEGVAHSRARVVLDLNLPESWKAACALTERDEFAGANYAYEATTLERLVDTPIMVGEHHKMYMLTEEGETPPQRLHVFSELASAIAIDEQVLENYKDMVRQSTILFESHPFPSMDILLATTNVLPRNGLEHLHTTMNIIPLGTLDDPDNLTGWNRMLIPHEYVHAWCGKYRRPAGMNTPDFHTPKGTELLWVYEGLTQHLGEVLEVRSGMMSADEYRWMLQRRLRWSRNQQGKQWRPLVDCCAASHVLRAGSETWGHLRRSQDYYAEGALVWLEADCIIREKSNGEKSLDDFCRMFFEVPENAPNPNPFGKADVVRMLNACAEHDWDAFLTARIERTLDRAPLDVAAKLGYRIEFTSERPKGPRNASYSALDALDSLGVSLSSTGTINTVMLESPADKAGLAPRMRVIAIGTEDDEDTAKPTRMWSSERFEDALAHTTITGKLTLLITAGDKLRPVTLEYDAGPRYMTMTRDDDNPDVLAQILMTR